MPLAKVAWVFRDLARQYPEFIFVYGDNAMRKGFGGQARELRHLPNSLGVATKWAPHMAENAFFSDSDPKAWQVVQNDMRMVEHFLKKGKTVIIPEDGIGTGRACLKTKAPKILEYINSEFERFEQSY